MYIVDLDDLCISIGFINQRNVLCQNLTGNVFLEIRHGIINVFMLADLKVNFVRYIKITLFS